MSDTPLPPDLPKNPKGVLPPIDPDKAEQTGEGVMDMLFGPVWRQSLGGMAVGLFRIIVIATISALATYGWVTVTEKPAPAPTNQMDE